MYLFSLESFLFLVLISLSLYFYSSTKRSTNTGFKNHPIVGTLPEFLTNRHRIFDWMAEDLAACPTNTSVFHRPGRNGVVTANPLNVEHILKTNFENYPKGDDFISLLEDFLGRGIFNTDGELWKVQRKTASYEFNSKSLRNFVMQNVIVETETRLIPILEKAAEKGLVLDLQDVLERFSFDNVCKLAFNYDPGCLAVDENSDAGAEFMRAFETAAELSSGRFRYAIPFLWKIKKFLNIGSERQLRESISAVHKFAEDIIRSRIGQGKGEEADLLSRFMGSHVENSSPEFLRDIVISFILAGRDSTSSALSWFFWVLSSRQDVQEKILNELEQIRGRNGKNIGDVFSYEDLRDLHYLHAAISESMRLYPPVSSDMKKCRKDDVLPDGTFVGKDWFVSYTNYAMGRMESIWGKNCLEFRPERWLDDDRVCRQESPFRYAVFHAGPRICLGKDMAYIQMKSIAASIIERFEVNVQEKEKRLEIMLSLTLRMNGGLPITVRKR
ncbi:hypothetical protein TIFTF001_038038 [Ficus carica]|uniref:Cytochrome P450 n=1 Tax=Ficus carica TaxID=3494 RepID=A0AA88J9K1_FICCA|nr:hypothetical protein TIFTF001_038038 [Ficus carica]